MPRPDLVPAYVEQIKPYPPGQPADRLRQQLGVAHLCQLASNENTAGPSPRVREALARALDELAFYPEGAGLALRERLAARHRVSPDQIVLGNGSGELVDVLCHAFLADGDPVVMSRLAFVQYRLSAWTVNAAIVDVPTLPDRRDDAEAFGRAAAGAKLVFLANPNNPTGTYVRRAELDRYFELAGDGPLTVVDQAYQEYVDAADYPNALADLAAGRQVIVLGTFSKLYGLAGLRLGYAVGPASLMVAVNKVKLPYNLNVLALVAALAALDDEGWARQTAERNAVERAFLSAELTRRDMVVTPSVANFLLVDMPAGVAWVPELERRGVLVRPLGAYGLAHSLRITVGTRAENLQLLAAVDEIAAGASA